MYTRSWTIMIPRRKRIRVNRPAVHIYLMHFSLRPPPLVQSTNRDTSSPAPVLPSSLPWLAQSPATSRRWRTLPMWHQRDQPRCRTAAHFGHSVIRFQPRVPHFLSHRIESHLLPSFLHALALSRLRTKLLQRRKLGLCLLHHVFNVMRQPEDDLLQRPVRRIVRSKWVEVFIELFERGQTGRIHSQERLHTEFVP